MSVRPSLRALLPLLFALAGALLALNIVSIAFGEAPVATLARIWDGTWGSAYGIGQVLFKATPLLFSALAFHVAYRVGLFNIGAEGQLALASLGGAYVATLLPVSTSAFVALPVVFVVPALIGASWSAIAGVLRARAAVQEVISTIMLNRIAEGIVPWALAAYIGSSSLRTADVPAGATLPRFEGLFPALRGSALSFAFVIAVAVTFGIYAWLARSRVGREMQWIGSNPRACEAEGIDVKRRILQAMLLSGAIAGAASLGTVFGYKGYYELGLGSGVGFAGIAVAMLGRRSALGLVLAAILFGTLEQAGLAINARVPKEAMAVVEAIVIVLVAIASRKSDEARALAQAEAK